MEVKILIKDRMGTGTRSKSTTKLVPGPGQYTIGSRIGQAPKYSMSSKSGNVDHTALIASPGPGNYEPNYNSIYHNNYSYSMRIRPNTSKERMNTPGPGNYNVGSDKPNQAHAWK